ncbi:hypothetical protein PHYC_02248 [Phycisphaerales bacterium]|nr:hypothetical protein PHYC_02248 [Phycisphaerales bacterium]
MRFLDTNAVISNLVEKRSDHQLVSEALQRLVSAGHELCICAQVVYEFWVVATRSEDRNGLGFDTDEVAKQIDLLLTAYSLLPEPADMISRWRAICTANRVRGYKAHDARLAAVAMAFGVDRVFSNNTDDFKNWTGITVVSARDC